MIKLTRVSKIYPIGAGSFTALSNISLEIKKGERVSILGASGSGKSTLMHIMGLLDTPTHGKVVLNGKDVHRLSDKERSSLRNQSVGFIFQQFNLIPNITALENILLPTIYADAAIPHARKQAMELLSVCGIEKRAAFYPNNLSGGEQQRVAIARALMMQPPLILADEPTGNLDSKTSSDILTLLEHLNRDRATTTVIVTHDPNVAKRTERRIMIRDGKIDRRKT